LHHNGDILKGFRGEVKKKERKLDSSFARQKKLSGSLEAFVSIVVSNYARNRGEQSSLGKKV
jgi:hypothetical protein